MKQVTTQQDSIDFMLTCQLQDLFKGPERIVTPVRVLFVVSQMIIRGYDERRISYYWASRDALLPIRIFMLRDISPMSMAKVHFLDAKDKNILLPDAT